MDKDKILLSNYNIQSSELAETDTTLDSRWIICDFGINGNNVRLNRNTIENWMSSLVNQPIVGKISVNSDNGNADFESHNQTYTTRCDENGNPYLDLKFNTEAFGVFTECTIENIDGVEYLIATAKLWKRFPEFCSLIKKRLQNGTLNTSWEIAVKKYHWDTKNGKKIKVIDDGLFMGHALLASFVEPAYKSSKLLEIASVEEEIDNELIEALSKDFAENFNIQDKIEQEREDDKLANVNKEIATVEPVNTEVSTDVQTEPIKEEPKEIAMLTQYDLNRAIRQAVSEKLNIERWDFSILFHFPADKTVWIQKWDSLETDVIVFTYEVSETDEVTVSEPVESKLTVSVAEINSTVTSYEEKIATLNESLVEASSTIQTLNTEVSNLKVYKEQFEQAEQEKIATELEDKQNELKEYATKSGFITEEELDTSEEIKVLIENLDKAGLNAIIAERFMATRNEDKDVEIETSTLETEKNTPKANITVSDDDVVVDPKTVMKSFLSK